MGRRDSGYDGTETGNTHVGGGPRAGAVAVVGASCWDGGVVAETGVRGRI